VTREFKGSLQRIERGIVTHSVLVPRAVSEEFGERGNVAVIARFAGGVEAHLTLIPHGDGRHHVLLNARLRKRLGLGTSGRVTVSLTRDESPPVDPVPEDLADALREMEAFTTFEKLARGKRNALLRWLDDAVADATRVKRVARLVEIALEAREKALDRAR
jgi:hypothetical protein